MQKWKSKERNNDYRRWAIYKELASKDRYEYEGGKNRKSPLKFSGE